MGDYCTLRFEAQVTLAGSLIVGRLVRGASWEGILASFPAFPIHPAWMRNDRHNFVPHGGLKHVPDGWEDVGKNDLEGTTWKVQCSVKTTSTAELFCEHILPYLIKEPCLVEYEHEYPYTGLLTRTVEPAIDPGMPFYGEEAEE
jgi:hypothetical protein